jgi:adenylosuccinate synthase
LLPELHNESTHQYQGVFRRGWLDIGKLKESVDGLGGVDYLAVSHLDYWCNLPEWEMYENGKFLFSTNSMNEYLAFMQTYLGVKIGMMAFGPTKEDREWTR